jgi:hypothetical protein
LKLEDKIKSNNKPSLNLLNTTIKIGENSDAIHYILPSCDEAIISQVLVSFNII